MIFDAGELARRRRDISGALELSCLCTTFRNFLFFCHFPDHHRPLPLFSFMVVGDRLITLARGSLLHRSPNLLDAVDEPHSPLMLARSRKSKSASTFEPELNLSHLSRSMGSCCSTRLADHRPHRKPPSLEPVVKMAAEGVTLIHQFSSTPVSSTTLPRWICSSSSLSATLPHPLTRTLSPPITCSPPTSRHIHNFRDTSERKLGLSLLGPHQSGPLCFSSWPITKSGGPTPLSISTRSVLNCKLINPLDYLSRHTAMNGRGLLSRLGSTMVQGFFDLSLPYIHVTRFVLLLMSIISCEKSLPFSSLWERSPPSSSLLKERTFLPHCLSTRGQIFLVAIPRNHLNFFTSLMFSGVRIPGGKVCFSTSQHKVTRIYPWGLTAMSLSTHLSWVSNLLSIKFVVSNLVLSVLTSFMLKVYCTDQRGWSIPSCCCMFGV